LTDISLSRPGVTVWPQLSKSVVWVAGAALYVALAMLATRWIAVPGERQPECGLRAIVLIFTAPGQPVSGGSSPQWFLQCKHFRFGIKTNKFSDRPPVFLTGAGNLFLK